MKNGGWLHKRDDAKPLPVVRYRPEPPAPKLPWSAILTLWTSKTELAQYEDLAASLGVTVDSLERLGFCWAQEHRAWAIPMRTGGNVVCGIRFRNIEGDKWAYKGSKQGIFIDPRMATAETVYIVEGATDTAAGISIGLNVIGRPSCRGCHETLYTAISRVRATRCVIIPDNDTPGLDGATALQDGLSIPSIQWTPPGKDLREAVKDGLTRQIIESQVRDLNWSKP